MTDMTREKGADNGTMPCPNGCGTELELIAEEDGKVAASVCPTCYGGTAAEQKQESQGSGSSNQGTPPAPGGQPGNLGGTPPEKSEEDE